jgi:hypothetical protein
MSLEKFVEESFVQICNGIRKAQERMAIDPSNPEEKKHFAPHIMPLPRGGSIEKEIYEIEFDIAITTSYTNSTTNSGEIKSEIVVIPATINLRREKKANQTNASVSRVQFSIPIIYPSMPAPHQTGINNE